MLPFAIGAETLIAIEAIEAIGMLGKTLDSLITLSSTSNITKINLLNEQEQELQQGSITKTILYENQPITDIQFSTILNERVLEIERMCQSKWQYFPSGILTVFTWALTGSALRHEFVIINTENHICEIEINKQSQEIQNQAQYILFVKIYYCENELQRKQSRTNILKGRSMDRVLASIKLNYLLYFSQINFFTNLVVVCLKQMMQNKGVFGKIDFCDKISKQMARSLYYFSQQNIDMDYVLQSIFGIFTDKPLHIPRLDMILVEKSIWNGIQISEEKKILFNNFMNVIKSIRASPDYSQTTIG